jgi:phosphoserine phosphatase
MIIKEVNYDFFYNNLEDLDFAIFDFDGTIYPKLFLYDLVVKVFEIKEEPIRTKKLKRLNHINNLYSENKFREAYLEFLDILRFEKKEEFVEITNKLLNNIYKYAEITVKKLHKKYDLDLYLISVTSDFVAKAVIKKLDMQGFEAINFLTVKKDGSLFFNGSSDLIIDTPKVMKELLLKRLFSRIDNKKKFVCFVNSEDDLPIVERASLKVGINPTKELLDKSKLDMVMIDRIDPWIKFCELL